MNNGIQKRIQVERRIVRAILKQAITEQGCVVSLNDGEEWVVKRSNKPAEIMDAIMSTDSDVLMIRDRTDAILGRIWLIYGNDGWDVIADYTDNEYMHEILKPANDLADRIQAAA